jgi:hypothetical protein
MNRCLAASLAALVALFASQAFSAEITLQRDDEGITVQVDGQLFTRYLFHSGAKPVLWPVIGPTGKEMTRAYPLRDAGPKEKKDHIHQRSFWFTHGDVNGTSFWHEMDRHGTIVHSELIRAEAAKDRAVLVTRNAWVDADGKRLCEDVRTITFMAQDDRRIIDFHVVVQAGDEAVRFGDTKEGSFGVRVAGSMDVDRKEGGRIVNSEGLEDAAAWGKRAAWVDYSGPVDDETLGVAILNHPSSFRFPSYWHVRTYGLFAANPFGVRDFLGDKNADGAHELKPGESFTLAYRVILHQGSAEEAGIAADFAKYAAEKAD